MREGSISNFKADLRVAQHKADLNVGTNVSAASIRAHGTVNLTGNYDADAVIDTNTIPLAPAPGDLRFQRPARLSGANRVARHVEGASERKVKACSTLVDSCSRKPNTRPLRSGFRNPSGRTTPIPW